MTHQSNLISEVLDGIAHVRVAVIGDVMIDEYLTGDVSRISPEAPVPVVRELHQRRVAGGAANVAANIVAMDASAYLVGVVGDDGGSDVLMTALSPFPGVCRNGMALEPGRRTTRKTRIIAKQQQIVRFDVEDVRRPTETTSSNVLVNGLEAINWADVVVLSDYGKGVLDDDTLRTLIDAARAARKVIIVDPKRANFRAYAGATILTPNCAELALATQLPLETDTQIEIAAGVAREQFGGELLVTRSEKGMSYFGDGVSAHVPTVAREVFDVSGAGDTVVAALACALAGGTSRLRAVQIANHAAGIVVSKSGTATLTRRELVNALLGAEVVASEPGRLVSWEEAAHLRDAWRSQGFTVGFANGCFDIIHPGHAALIRQATAACDRLILALNSDASVRRLKGPTRPVQKEAARAAVIGAMRGVSLVVVFEQDTPLELITVLEPDVLIKGADYTIDNVIGADLVLGKGGRVVLADLVTGQSTTSLLSSVQR
ncbi:MAG: bifunctional heptose 7-phosphate kinase/heptose 1-phosphate adenyltransferase [Bradyrhizobium sp.]|nr:bifunctional heptose 7-phosphate kinase/heptose 1-phosphate adenyltransferase [Bradyrhizobium sp.]